MAELLYRLGRFSARRAWTVVAAWAAVLILSVAAFIWAGGTLSSNVPIPGTETERVTDQLRESLPDASSGTGTLVLHTTNSSAFTSQQREEVGGLLDNLQSVAGVDRTVNPFDAVSELEANRIELDRQLAAVEAQRSGVPGPSAELDKAATSLDLGSRLLALAERTPPVSQDGSTALATVVFDVPQQEITPEGKALVADYIAEHLPRGVEVDFSSEIAPGTTEVFGMGEVAGLVIAALTLLIMLGTAIATALPLITAILGVAVGVTATLSMSSIVEMISLTPVLGVMLGLAVGIDYSLFILNRHRRQLLAGIDVHESIGLANGTSGNAVVFAGSTVLVALLALNITGIGFLGLMGTVGAICVAVAIVLAVTLTPALLGLAGTRILSRRTRAAIGQAPAAAKPVRPMGALRAVGTVIATIAALATIAVPALSMRLGLPDGSAEPPESTQYRAYQLIDDKFGPGMNGPLLVVAELDTPPAEEDMNEVRVELGELLLQQNGVVGVLPLGVSEDRTIIAFRATPAEGPSSASTEQLVRDLRNLSPLPDGVDLGVAGVASGNIDVSQQLADALPRYLAVVIGLSVIIMILAFRSILVPLTATLGFVLSLAATFGGVTAIFQWGWLGELFGIHEPGPVLSFLPTVLIGILFGLAMDYQLFLVSGMREAFTHGSPAHLAVSLGFRSARSVVTAAAIIMVSVFGGFIFSRSPMVRSIGFALAFGVLLDAFVIRMLLIPATMRLLGDSAWWLPRWLDRILPRVDIEGAALTRQRQTRPEEHSANSSTGGDWRSACSPQRRR